MRDPADIDIAHASDEASPAILAAILGRLERSSRREQMTYRECELNEALRIVDCALVGPAVTSAERARLRDLARGLTETHRLVGSEERPGEAAGRLRALIAAAGR